MPHCRDASYILQIYINLALHGISGSGFMLFLHRENPVRHTGLHRFRAGHRRHLPAAAACSTISVVVFSASAKICFCSSSEMVFALRSLVRSSVAPVAIALKIFFWLSISIEISTVAASAPALVITSIISWRILRISSSVGFATFRSICSRTSARETPIVEMYGAFSAILCRIPIFSPKYGTTTDAEPPPPTRQIRFGFRL